MGFRRTRKLYPLDFKGTTLEGLTMVMRGVSVQEYLDLTSLSEIAKEAQEKQHQDLLKLFGFVVEKIEEWDLEDDDGRAVVPTVQELLSWDFGDAMAAIDAWLSAVGDPSAPLERKSNAGSKWVGEPIPMDIPSPSLPSLPTPN